MRWFSLCVSAITTFTSVALITSIAHAELPALKVSENHRFLLTDDGKPFFYLADTAWELFHRLNHDDTELYLADRVAKKFNVIQACVLAEYGGLTVPNAQGHLPLQNNDPAKPNEDYFADVDWTVNKAESLGLYVGMLPTWGDKVTKKWGQGPEIFTPENAKIYGEFLGKRYKGHAIIWILGGDRPVENDKQLAIWRAMAEGLKQGDGGTHLMTYHPSGLRSSSEWFQKDAWLDFNMLQSGHSAKDIIDWGMIWADYQKQPTKPVVDGEANYEDHPIAWKSENGWFTDFDVRRQSYYAVFAGAFGQTYGCHDVWQFYHKGIEPVSHARTEWKEALKLPGASQMRHLRALMESRPYLSRVPDQSLLKSPEGKDGDHCQATRDADGTYAMIYIPNGKAVKVDLTKLTGPRLKAWWFDPKDGGANPAGEFENKGTQEFTPPVPEKANEPNDWVLVIDDAGRQFPAPGTVVNGR